MLSTMILRPKLLRHAPVALTGAAPAALATPVPTWLRAVAAGPDSSEDAAFAAAAALTALDAVVRRQERWAGAWRQRLALGAAAATAKRAGRVEDEAALRDALLLTRPGDDVGPAGRMLLAWRTLASRPVATLVSEGYWSMSPRIWGARLTWGRPVKSVTKSRRSLARSVMQSLARSTRWPCSSVITVAPRVSLDRGLRTLFWPTG